MGNVPSSESVSLLQGPINNLTGCPSSLSAAECAWANRWFTNLNTAEQAYGIPVIYLSCVVLGLFTATNAMHRGRQTRLGAAALSQTPAYRFIVAAGRAVAGRQVRVGTWCTVSSGSMILAIAMVVSALALCVGPGVRAASGVQHMFFKLKLDLLPQFPQQYYWPSSDYGHSPPLATRAGWMSLAILPFQVLLATKWNFITILTGVSHEHLQPLHRWSGWLMYLLALIHTFPFAIVDLNDGSTLERWRSSGDYWTGIATLVTNTFLMVMSIGAIRNRYYETFKSLHLIFAAAFFVLLFLHCNFAQTSADYFFGLAAVYLASFVIRWGRCCLHGFRHRASVEVLEGAMLRISIPTHIAWTPGQHFFFRFLETGAHSFTSHPFTVASLPASGNIEVFARVRRGVTTRLADVGGEKQVSIPVLLDGPYGGSSVSLETYDRVLLVGGGSGGSFILAMLRHLATIEKDFPCKSISVIYSTRTSTSLTWFLDAFRKAVDNARHHLDIDFKIHVTSGPPTGLPRDNCTLRRTPSTTSSSSTSKHEGRRSLAIVQGRPNISLEIERHMQLGGTLGVAACGPAGMASDVRNAVAEGQMRIATGMSATGECYLHTEAFGW